MSSAPGTKPATSPVWALLNSLKSRGSTPAGGLPGKLTPSSGGLKASERRRAAADAVCAALDKAGDADPDVLYAVAFSAPAASAFVCEMQAEPTDFPALRVAADDARAAVTVAADALRRAETAASATKAGLAKIEA